MRVNKIAACVLGATMFWQSSALVFASDKEMPILTLEHAIEQAKNTSIELKIHDINYDLAKEGAEIAGLMGGYQQSLEPKMKVEYMRKTEDLLESKVTLDVMMLFDDIILAEEQLELKKMNLAIHENAIKKAEIEFGRGLKSELDLHTLKLQQDQLEKDLAKLEQDIAINYEKLCDTIGVRSQRYILDKGGVAYEPYRDIPNINGFASSKAEDHIQLWKASEDLRIALETAPQQLYPGEYMPVVTKQADRKVKEKNVEDKEQKLEQAIKQKYIDIKQLEVNYEAYKKNLELREKQIRVNKVFLEKGMMSPLEYDQSVVDYEKDVLKLMELESQHALLAYQLDNPHLITVN